MQLIQFGRQGDPQLLVAGQSLEPVLQLQERWSKGRRGGTQRDLRLKLDWQGWEKTWGSNLAAEHGQVETASVFFSCFSLPLPLKPLGIKQPAGLLSLKVKADLFDMWPFKMSDKYLFSISLLNNSLMLLHNCCITLQLFSFRFLGSAQPLLLIINKYYLLWQQQVLTGCRVWGHSRPLSEGRRLWDSRQGRTSPQTCRHSGRSPESWGDTRGLHRLFQWSTRQRRRK